MELGIDTSSDFGGVALSNEGRLLAEICWKPGQNHSSELHPNISRLMEIARADFSMLTAVYVATGPGSFNGLRAGISTARGIAFAGSIPVTGISTLEIEAFQYAGAGYPICPVHDAGRGELAAALYTDEGGWRCLKDAHLTTIEQLCAETAVPTLFCGEIPERALAGLRELPAGLVVLPGWTQRLRRPACLCALGWKYMQSGRGSDPAALQPIYLRQPPITQRKKKY
jgi:tRNA threonylcarbamoyladenosine biosynthesis protein TsaB